MQKQLNLMLIVRYARHIMSLKYVSMALDIYEQMIIQVESADVKTSADKRGQEYSN